MCNRVKNRQVFEVFKSFLYFFNSLKCQPLTNTFPQINEKRISFCFACFDVQFSSGCPAVEDILPGSQKIISGNQFTSLVCHGLNHSSCCWIHWGVQTGLQKTGICGVQDTRQIHDNKTNEMEKNNKKVVKIWYFSRSHDKKLYDNHNKPSSSHGFDYKLVSLFSFSFEYCIVVLLWDNC